MKDFFFLWDGSRSAHVWYYLWHPMKESLGTSADIGLKSYFIYVVGSTQTVSVFLCAKSGVTFDATHSLSLILAM